MSGGAGVSHRFGSGDGQLAHPDTTYVAYAFKADDDGVAADPGTASFSGAVPASAAFSAVAGDSGTFKATLASGPLDPGLREELATATVDGESTMDSVPVLALEDDDQAPGVDLVGSGNDAWRRLDSVDGEDLDDVYAITLGRATAWTWPSPTSRPTRWPPCCSTPNPFEPRPHDGDRDTTTFAMTSSERGRLRVVIYRYATDVVRVLVSGELAAGRQRVSWTGKTSSGAWLRGRFSYVLEATDLAGNTSRSQRHYVPVL